MSTHVAHAPGDVTIFEGPDGGGKTTLIESWAMPSTTVIHVGPPAHDPYTEMVALLNAHQEDVAFDRFHIGETIYGPIFRGRNGLERPWFAALEARLAARRAVVVICLPPYDVARANWLARRAAGREMFADRYDDVYRGFAAQRHTLTTLPSMRYDYTTATWTSAAIQIAKLRATYYAAEEEPS